MTDSLYTQHSLSQCLTEGEMKELDKAFSKTKLLKEILHLTDLYPKLPAVAAYFRQSQLQVVNVVKLNCYTTIQEFLLLQGKLTTPNFNKMRQLLALSKIEGGIYSLSLLVATYEIIDQELGEFTLMSESTIKALLASARKRAKDSDANILQWGEDYGMFPLRSDEFCDPKHWSQGDLTS